MGHEIEETITDPGAEDVINGVNLGGWYDYSAYENGDKCAWVGYTEGIAPAVDRPRRPEQHHRATTASSTRCRACGATTRPAAPASAPAPATTCRSPADSHAWVGAASAPTRLRSGL